MTAMLPSSWRSPAAGVRSFNLSICPRCQLKLVSGDVLLDASDPLGAGDRGDVVALREQPGQGHLCRCCTCLGGNGLNLVDDAQVALEVLAA